MVWVLCNKNERLRGFMRDTVKVLKCNLHLYWVYSPKNGETERCINREMDGDITNGILYM